MLLMTKLCCSVFIRPHGMAVTGTNCTHMPGIGFHTQHRYENSAKGIKTAHLGMKWRPRVWNKSMTVWKIWQMLWKYDMPIVCALFMPISIVIEAPCTFLTPKNSMKKTSGASNFLRLPTFFVPEWEIVFCICFMVYSRFVLFSCLSV